MTTKDIYWLAGLLEGEGCFTIHKGRPIISLAMTDRDVIEHAQSLLRYSSLVHEYKRVGCKTIFSIAISGKRAISWMFIFYSLLHNRRRARVRGLVLEWLKIPLVHSNTSGFCKMGHILSPSKRYIYSTGYIRCKKCYLIARNARLSRQNNLQIQG